jgi:hypothetical protein
VSILLLAPARFSDRSARKAFWGLFARTVGAKTGTAGPQPVMESASWPERRNRQGNGIVKERRSHSDWRVSIPYLVVSELAISATKSAIAY